MPEAKLKATHRGQRGQTLLLVAVSLVVLIAMAALAIDVTTLYVARSEMQRAADAAALAGAKAFVDSGVTNDPANAYPNLRTLSQSMATIIITQLLAQDKVGSIAPSLSAGTPTFDFTTHPGDPRVTVTLQRTNVPTFFARIWGKTSTTVSATATAEAYNSSNPSGTAADGTMPPVAPSCVKPLLVTNVDPNHAPQTFISPNGAITNPGVWTGAAGSGIVTEEITLGNIWPIPPGLTGLAGLPGYLAANIAATSGPCPGCGSGTPSPMSQSIACCDTENVYTCGGTAGPPVLIDLLHQRVVSALEGVSCLITGGTGGGGGSFGDDTIDFSEFQATSGGAPIEVRSGTGPNNGRLVTTSGQIVTLPIIDTTLLNAVLGQVKVIGFMQAFIKRTENKPGGGVNLVVDVLNISGCGSNINTAATPVSGGGVSPVPVRLVQNP